MNRPAWMRPALVGLGLIVIIVAVLVAVDLTGSNTAVPSAPRSVTASAGSASATVSWTAPRSHGGSAITSYVATSHPSGRSCTTTTLSCVVTGLSDTISYTFTVVARNHAGTSPASSPSNAVTPESTTPVSPTLIVRPSTTLVNGQKVTVSGYGFTPNDQVFLVECLAHATSEDNCDTATATPVTISASGDLPSTSFTVITGTIGNGTCGTRASNLDSCALSAGNASGGDSTQTDISFAG